ncbi:MAG: hypothetical protein LDL39_07450 [Magnetospirillum sp.]|nr:hypothetical protein [Magnetospirillum sp.]
MKTLLAVNSGTRLLVVVFVMMDADKMLLRRSNLFLDSKYICKVVIKNEFRILVQRQNEANNGPVADRALPWGHLSF